MEALVISMGLHSQEPKITRECKRERSPLRTSGSLLQLATLAALTGHRTTAGWKRYGQPELSNSLFHTGSATRVPADGDFLAPAMRSTGFKTDLIPQPARVPPAKSKRTVGSEGTFPSWDGPGGRFRFVGRGLLWVGETPPTSFSSFLRPMLGARPSWQPEGWAAPKS